MSGAAVTVQVDESGAAFGAAFVATDVTAKVAAGLGFDPITVDWGRQDQYSQITPSSVGMSFKNTDGAWSPGAHAWVRRNMRRRVLAVVSSTTVNLSDDYATTIEAQPSKDGVSTSAISGQDILTRFGGVVSSDVNSAVVGTTLRSFLAEEMLLDSPTALYMLQEAEGATSFADVTGVKSPATVVNSKAGPGVVTAGQSVNGNFLAGTAVQVANKNAGSGVVPGSYISVPAASSYFEVWATLPTSAPTNDGTIAGGYGSDVGGFLLNLTGTTGHLQLLVFGTGTINVDAPVTLDGNMHQFYVTIAANNTTAKVYMDGALLLSGSSAAFTRGTVPSTSLGAAAATYIGPTSVGEVYSGSYAFMAVYSADIGATRVLAHYNAGANAFTGERCDTRITRLLSYRPNTGSVTETGYGYMGTQDIQGRSLTDCLLEVGQVEGGAVFVDGLGRVNFRSRSRLFNPAVTVTLDCLTGCVDFGSNWREDTQNVLNDVTVSRNGGADQRYYDATSITKDGEYSTTVTLAVDTDANALSTAGWMVSNGTPSQSVCSPILVDLLHCPAATALAVLQLKPLDCVQIVNAPVPAPAATMTFIVQGGSLSLAVDAQQASLNVTALPPTVVAIDGDAAHGIGATAIIGY